MRPAIPIARRVAVTLLTAATAALALAAGPRHPVEGIVVRVNDRILTIADMRMRVLERAAETGKPVPDDQLAALVSDSADELCLLERAIEAKVEVSDDEVSAAIKQVREQNHVQDDAAFEQMLRGMGLSAEQLRRRMRDTILINRVLGREVGSLPVTEEELKQRFARDQQQYSLPERVHLEHVILPVAADRSDEDRRLAEARRLAAAARAGGAFGALVDEQVKAGAGSGGDLGTLAITDLRPEVRDAVAKLAVGEISEPFASPAGVHVVHLVERVPPTVRPFAEVVEELRQAELAERYHTRLRGVVDELKKRYVVETHPEAS